jgi:hypothetical protein
MIKGMLPKETSEDKCLSCDGATKYRAVHEFENGYGASVISCSCPRNTMDAWCCFIMGSVDAPYELAVLHHGDIVPDAPLTYVGDGVVDYLTEGAVVDMLRQISELAAE